MGTFTRRVPKAFTSVSKPSPFSVEFFNEASLSLCLLIFFRISTDLALRNEHNGVESTVHPPTARRARALCSAHDDIRYNIRNFQHLNHSRHYDSNTAAEAYLIIDLSILIVHHRILLIASYKEPNRRARIQKANPHTSSPTSPRRFRIIFSHKHEF